MRSSRRHPGIQLEEGEVKRASAMAVLRGGLSARLHFGFLWSRYHQVELVLSDRRLIELARPFGGRTPGCRIRSWRWQELHLLQLHRLGVELESASGHRVRWRILDLRHAEEFARQLAAGDPTPADLQDSDRAPAPTWHCPRCARALTHEPARCAACGTRFVTPRAATWLAAALPGGGHLATGHWVVGIARALLELAFVASLWLGLSADQMIREFPALALVFLGAVVGVKAEAVLTARAFARLLVPWSSRARHLWTAVSCVGATTLLLWAASALLFAGHTTRVLTHDLEFHEADHWGWEARYRAASSRELDEAVLRSTWTHEDRWRLEVWGRPLAPWQTPEEWLAAEQARRRDHSEPIGEAVHAGAMDGIKFVSVDSGSGGEMTHLEIAVIDRRRRAVHTLGCDVFSDQLQAAEALLLHLLRRAHWIRAASPCNPSWRPE